MNMRVGFGYDVHRLEEGYDLIIGGVKIPSEKGAVAHSDGDVLIHAICDAILGALGQGDIGRHFPDSDPRYKDMASTGILKYTLKLAQDERYRVINIDSTVCLQSPKLAPFTGEMKEMLQSVVGAEDISIKATTTEKLGFVGEGSGISAYAVALLRQ